MNPTELANCEEEYRDTLTEAAAALPQAPTGGLPYFLVELSQRVLGICALLSDADTDAFVDRLERSGTARLELQKLPGRGVPCDTQLLTATKAVGFPAAIASGNLDLSAQIARVLPDRHDPEWEYEDDFLFVDVMRRAVIGVVDGGTGWTAGARDALARWGVVLKKRKSPERDVWVALVAQDQSAFAGSFPAVVNHRLAQFEVYKKQPNFDSKLFAAEGHVWIEGLALLEIATRLGLSTEPAYQLLPSLARSQRSQRKGPNPDWLKE